MVGVRSRFCHRVDEAGTRAAVGSIVRIVGDLEFLNGLLAEDVRNTCPPARFAGIITRRTCTVHGEGIGTVAVRVPGIGTALVPRHAHQAKIAVGVCVGGKGYGGNC